MNPPQPPPDSAKMKPLSYHDSQVRLDPNEIEAGMKITILKWTAVQDRSWLGVPMEVIKVDAPFIIVTFTDNILGKLTKHLDSRAADFIRVSDEYVTLIHEEFERRFA